MNGSHYSAKDKFSVIVDKANIIELTGILVGDYSARVYCFDDYGQEGFSNSISFEVQEEEEEDDSSNGLGGVFIGSVSSYVSESGLQSGYTRNLRKSDSLWFNHDGEKHFITIDKIDENSVDITVQSEPQKFNIKVGKSVNVDLNDDGVYDVEITYVEYLRTLVSLKVRAISEEYEEPKIGRETSSADNNEGIFDEGVVAKSNSWIWWLVAVVLIVVVVLFVLNRKGFSGKKKKRR